MLNQKIKKMVGIALLMAVVVVLQLLGSFVKLGPVEVSLVLLPIVIGAAVYGPVAGAVLGATFGAVVLAQPGTVFFYDMSVFGTVIIVMTKGALSGLLAGLTYKALAAKAPVLAVILCAIVCPVVNTAIFFLGCMTFFYEGLSAYSPNVALYVITAFIGLNFVAEFLINVLCCPVIMRLLHVLKKSNH